MRFLDRGMRYRVKVGRARMRATNGVERDGEERGGEVFQLEDGQSERERERPNLGIISGLARDKPGQRRPNEVKPRVNGALRFDSSFSTRNWLVPKITHNIVVTMIEYFYISVVFPISLSLSLSRSFLLSYSLV